MTLIAAHIRIFDAEPSDELVVKRTAAISEIAKAMTGRRSVSEILQTANDLATAVLPGGTLSAAQSSLIETAIRKSSEAFIAEGHGLEMVVCGMLGTHQAIESAESSTENVSVTDVLALGLWSALSFQKKRTEEKLEKLRSELLEAAHAHCMASASHSRERREIGDIEFAAPEPFDSRGVTKSLEPFQAAIGSLRANAAVDREEIDLLWWVLSDRSTILKRKFSTDKNAASAAVASGIEAASLLRRIPATAHCHLVLRNTPGGKSLSLQELLASVSADRATLAAALKAHNLISQSPAIFPLLTALRTGEANSPDAKAKKTLEDWAGRALLECAICHLGSNLPSVSV